MYKRSRALIAALGLLAAITITAATITHKVKRGDTVYSISNRYGISQETLFKYNPQAREGLKAGQVLVLPDNGTVQQQEPAPVNDKTYHTIQKGESLFGIAKQYGMSVDDLLALNPQVDADGYAAGTVLRLRKDTAVPAKPKAATAEAPAREIAEEAAHTPAVTAPAQADDDTAEALAKTVTEARPSNDNEITVITEETTPSVAIMLPFMSTTPATKDKRAQHVTDFLRGFLIAADTLSHSGANVDILVYDTHNSLDSITRLMRTPEVQRASVIITPSDTIQLQAITSKADKDTWVLNLFAVKDESFMTNPRMIQANIPHDEMYGKAIDAFITKYKGYTPVFLTKNEGKKDKAEFTDMLRSQLKADGIQWIDVNYNGYLTEALLSDLDDQGHYVFIPASGAKSEFLHFAPTLKKFSEGHSDPTAVKLFGYPEWVTFDSNNRELLGDLNASIYSRFFLDELDYGVRKVNQQFLEKYGREMLEVYPSQALLGYDTGCYVIKALRGDYRDGKFGRPADGLQTPIHLDYDAETGPVNTAVYLITFTPGGFADKTVL